jgi:hypothetical protein
MHSTNMTYSGLGVSPFVAQARTAIRQFDVKILRALFGILYLGLGSLPGASTEEDRLTRLRDDLPAHSESPPSIRLKSGGGIVISLPGRTRFRHSLKSGERDIHFGNRKAIVVKSGNYCQWPSTWFCIRLQRFASSGSTYKSVCVTTESYCELAGSSIGGSRAFIEEQVSERCIRPSAKDDTQELVVRRIHG